MRNKSTTIRACSNSEQAMNSERSAKINRGVGEGVFDPLVRVFNSHILSHFVIYVDIGEHPEQRTP